MIGVYRRYLPSFGRGVVADGDRGRRDGHEKGEKG